MSTSEKSMSPWIRELIDQMDGPGPDVVLETLSPHIISSFCPHCQTLIAEPAGSVELKPIPIRTK